MTTRTLPPAEWPRLAGTEAEQVWPTLDPGKDTVLVVEQDGQIVGCWVQMWLPHLHCLWIDPAHRKSAGVARRLWTGMRRWLAVAGLERVITSAMSPDVSALLAHVKAERLPGEHYVMQLAKET